jgi:hypothetical protein
MFRVAQNRKRQRNMNSQGRRFAGDIHQDGDHARAGWPNFQVSAFGSPTTGGGRNVTNYGDRKVVPSGRAGKFLKEASLGRSINYNYTELWDGYKF